MKETLGNHASPSQNVQLRRAEIGDEPFLVWVYASARAQKLVVPWDEQQKSSSWYWASSGALSTIQCTIEQRRI